MNENFYLVPQSTTLEPNTCPLPQKECLEDKNRSGNFEKGVRVKLWGVLKARLLYVIRSSSSPSLLAPVPSSIPFEVIHSSCSITSLLFFQSSDDEVLDFCCCSCSCFCAVRLGTDD